jgi:hypothetical protein
MSSSSKSPKLARTAIRGAAALSLGLLACAQNTTTGASRTFNRPVRVAFACIETTTGNPRSLSDCTTGAQGIAMHALVLQESRGEVAAVDLVARTVIDSDRGVPGYSFVPASALPTSIVVPRNAPQCAFVASAGNNAIDAIDLRRFRRESAPTAELHAAAELPGQPSAMVLSPTEDALWLSLPERGSVVRVGLDGCNFVSQNEIMLDATLPAATRWDGSGDLARICPTTGFTGATPATLIPRTYTPTSLGAHPQALEVGRELLVGDANLPLIHRIDFDTQGILPSIATGAPIRSLVVTPDVPNSSDPADPTRGRFIYAIDEEDGTVMVVDYSDPSATGFGAVIPVGPEGVARPDRLPLLTGARTLAVLTPSYDPTNPFAAACDPTVALASGATAPGVTALRGVFVGVGLTDSTVRFVDVFDSDALCRGRVVPGSTECDGSESFVYIRRHRPRMGEARRVVGATASEVSFVLDGASVRISAELPDAGLGLTRLSCGDYGLQPIFAPTDASGLVCGQFDPYAALAELWSAQWNGPLLSTVASSGRLHSDGDAIVLDSAVDFCAAGALGADNMAATDAAALERGPADIVRISSALSATMLEDERCQIVAGIEGSSRNARPIDVSIQRTYGPFDGLNEPFRGRLVFDPDALVLDRSAATPVTMRDVLRCVGNEFVRFDVRVRDVFAIAGSRSGQSHRVVTTADGQCAVDAAQDARRISRVRAGQPFNNGALAFQVTRPPSIVSATSTGTTEFRVVLGNVPATLNVDVGFISQQAGRQLALPADISWNGVNQRLYIIDIERRGLLELQTLPLSYTTSSFN